MSGRRVNKHRQKEAKKKAFLSVKNKESRKIVADYWSRHPRPSKLDN